MRCFCFATTVLFSVIPLLINLPAAVRMVNIQRWISQNIDGDYEVITRQAGNEAILAIAEVTRQPPDLNGFNGILNPDSKAILASVLHR